MIQKDALPTDLLFHLIGLADPACGTALRVGDRVELRPDRGGREVEAWSADGQRLGRLPPEERDAVTGLIGGALSARIAALVPRPLQAGAGRIHIRLTYA